jgi:DNA-binding MarR family transcriptional regulator
MADEVSGGSCGTDLLTEEATRMGDVPSHAEAMYPTWLAARQATELIARAIDEQLRPWRLTWEQVLTLTVLSIHGPQSMSVLARFLLQQVQTTSLLVDRLVQRGLARRINHPTDRRVVLVEVTSVAQATLHEIGTVGWSVIADAFGTLAPQECEQLKELTQRVRNRAAELAAVPAAHWRYAEELPISPRMTAADAGDEPLNDAGENHTTP